MESTPQLHLIEKSRQTYSSESYQSLLNQLVDLNQTTGKDQSEELVHYTNLNLHRMNRLKKTLVLDDALIRHIEAIAIPQTWYIITEAWCGDAAQNLPVFIKAAEHSSFVKVVILLRDENLDIMDQYLTGNARSIPKIISIDENGQELFVWGPRPAATQSLFDDFKAKPVATRNEFIESIQRWYNQDKGKSVQAEMLGLQVSVLIEK